MFCSKCGKEISEGSAFCQHCGSPTTLAGGQQQRSSSADPIINTEALNERFQDFSTKAKSAAQALNESKTRSNLFYITLALAVLECIFPLMSWVTVPLYNSIGQFFGASGDISSYSLFGYLGTVQANGSTFTLLVVLILCIGSLVAMICNVLYIWKGWKNTAGYYKFGRIASLLLVVVSLVFLVVMGFTALILRLIKITFIPFLALAVSILNQHLIKKLKSSEE